MIWKNKSCSCLFCTLCLSSVLMTMPPSLLPLPLMIIKPLLSWFPLLGSSSGHEERLVCCRSSTDWKQWLCQFHFWTQKVSQTCFLLRVWHWPCTGMKNGCSLKSSSYANNTWQRVWANTSFWKMFMPRSSQTYSTVLHIFFGGGGWGVVVRI